MKSWISGNISCCVLFVLSVSRWVGLLIRLTSVRCTVLVCDCVAVLFVDGLVLFSFSYWSPYVPKCRLVFFAVFYLLRFEFCTTRLMTVFPLSFPCLISSSVGTSRCFRVEGSPRELSEFSVLFLFRAVQIVRIAILVVQLLAHAISCPSIVARLFLGI